MGDCEVCGNEQAKYVCSSCRRKVGPVCFNIERWQCVNCLTPKGQAVQFEAESGRLIFATTLLFLALLMVFTGVILLAVSSPSIGQGGFVVIFPFFFASSGGSGFILLPALAVVAVMVILAYLSYRKAARE